MAKQFRLLTAVSGAAFLLALLWYGLSPAEPLLSLCISLGVVAYHLVMRLLVGTVINGVFHNRMDYTKRWFQPFAAEQKLYAFLRVKTWKVRVPAYAPDTFSLTLHSLDEIVQATCQAEIVHEIILLLSFLPLLLIIPFGETILEILVFIVTSLLAATIDLIFVITQRFNRPRLLKAANRAQRKREHHGNR